METLSSLPPARQAVFADTSALFAITFLHDQYHSQAVRISNQLGESGAQIVTSNFVVAEFLALVRRICSAPATAALKALDSSDTQIERALAGDEAHAREILDRFQGHGYTLTDATSFAMMERLGISIAFTFDNHFALQGYTIPT